MLEHQILDFAPIRGQPVLGLAVLVEQGQRILGPGEFFGEIALLDNGPRTATVVAATPMRYLVLGHEQFRDVLHQNADIAIKMLRVVTVRLRAAAPLSTG